MLDSMELRVGDLVFADCQSYSSDSDLFLAGDTFSFEVPGNTRGVKKGDRCELWVNGSKEMTGVLERVRRKTSKADSSLVLEGRDLLGVVVDSHVEEFIDLSGISLRDLALRLLAPLTFINRKDILIEEGLKPTAPADPDRAPHADPGESVFDVLSRAAKARGLIFYSEPAGRLVFGKPRADGAAGFHLVHKLASDENNVIESDFDDNISKRYSKVVVIGQTDTEDAEEINIMATVTDPSFPFYKACVVELPHDTADAKAFGRLELAKQRAQGWSVTYTVSGFSLEGKNWTANRIVNIADEFNEIKGNYLIYGRKFLNDKKEGKRTILRVGLPGVLQ